MDGEWEKCVDTLRIDRINRPKESIPLTVVTVDVPKLTDGPALDRFRQDVVGLIAENPGIDLLVDNAGSAEGDQGILTGGQKQLLSSPPSCMRCI